jgi:hypothetical protein
MVRFRVVFLGASLAWAVLAGAVEDELLPGTTLALRQVPKKSEHLVVVVRASLPAPLPGGTDDPRLTGARVEIGNPATGEWARLDAPPAGWSVNRVGTLFRFRNASPKDRRDQPVAIVIRHGKRLKIVGRAIGISLDETTQQRLAVVVTSGTRRYCLVFGGKIRRDEPGRFVARAAPVPASCPAPSEAPTPPTSTTSSTRPRPGRATTTSTTSTTATTPIGVPGPTTSSTAPSGTTSSTASLPGSSSSTTTPSPTVTSTSTASLPPPSTTTTTSTSSTAPPPGDPCDDLNIPGGHRPGPGRCRVWFIGRSPGQQPPAGDCDVLEGDVPEGACLIRG